MANEIDAVVVATPDHVHAVASVAAMKLGKHVYCEKPLTWSIGEARVMRKVAMEKKVVTQMGNQGMGDNRLRQAVQGCLVWGHRSSARNPHLEQQTHLATRDGPTDRYPACATAP
jgi:hypothetical protein